MAAVGSGRIPWFVLPLLSFVIGVAFSGLTFVGHELLHGAIVRGRALRHVAGWVTFLPHMISPRTWVAWHNRIHHAHANQALVDPDANPTLAQYAASHRVRVITDHFAPGR